MRGQPSVPPPGWRPDRYSRFVTIAKVTLPLVALAMLAALFLVQPADEGSGLVFSEADLDALGNGLHVANARFDGTNRTGDRFRFHAAQVEPDAAPPTRAALTDLTGTVDYADGPTVNLKSDEGDLVLATRLLTLTGNVRITTSEGQSVAAREVVLDLAAGSLRAEGGVETGADGGAISSENLRVDPPGGAGEARRFSFGNGVRLRYDPPAAYR